VDGFVAFGILFAAAMFAAARFGTNFQTPFERAVVPLVVVGTAVILFMLLYSVLMEAALGATLGKMTAEARVQSTRNGRLIGLEAALIRNVMRLIDGIGFYLIGGIVAMLTPRRQRLGDLVARSVVVHRPTFGGLRVISLLIALAIGIGGVVLGLQLRGQASDLGQGRLESVVVTDDPAGTVTKISMLPTIGKIYLNFTLVDAAPGTSIKARWLAGAASSPGGGFSLGETEIRTGVMQSGGTFTLDTPPNGWAVGEYRVELSVNGGPARTERFFIRPEGAASPTGSAVPPPTATSNPTPTR
jgi:uncharacterized RDD family membrane protein YckC